MDVDVGAWWAAAWTWLQLQWSDHYAWWSVVVVSAGAAISFIVTVCQGALEIRKHLKEDPITWPWGKGKPPAPTPPVSLFTSQTAPGTTRPSGIYIPTSAERIRILEGALKSDLGSDIMFRRPGATRRWGLEEHLRPTLVRLGVLALLVLLFAIMGYSGWAGTIGRFLLLVVLPCIAVLLAHRLAHRWLYPTQVFRGTRLPVVKAPR